MYLMKKCIHEYIFLHVWIISFKKVSPYSPKIHRAKFKIAFECVFLKNSSCALDGTEPWAAPRGLSPSTMASPHPTRPSSRLTDRSPCRRPNFSRGWRARMYAPWKTGSCWKSPHTVSFHASPLWGRRFKPRTPCGKVGSCLLMVGSLQYRTLTHQLYALVSSAHTNYPSWYDLYSVLKVT